ncbi:hypothetical protein GXW83_31225 [Streptacidiphilus sp. PB12-B1b]|uniref:hypothetical protein n=1 Tax=Streptacidiphilus sp. PB12-B1b TaxID=2705012 RepID=UPI0015F8CF65|nr:hypothetical protein [Streptacidiphilus sp. PB12-B1b]QMU79511.1 hypothetical protein GXW83_31225 [Streptacidiphilus sp. PB12-B1b]
MFRALTTGCAAGALLVLGTLSSQAPCWAAESGAPLAKPSAELQPPDAIPALTGLGSAVASTSHPVKTLRVDPLAASKADPLSNGLAVQPDSPGVSPVATSTVTGPLSAGGGLASLPVVNTLASALPG